ncbi:MAG: TadE/TadG family type IV pilus assembly protein [Myxococcota bacterium]|nr:TadE/TadG family type IV pilus assembly protein [Myxococcota bacterium]
MKRSHILGLVSFSGLALVLAARAGGATWARENEALLSGAVATSYAEATPLPGPFYNQEIVLYALLAAACGFAVWRLGLAVLRACGLIFRRLRTGQRPAMGESGQAMTEVVVSFPVLLITTLILMQMALMYQARNVVTYAAFSAARAAIVWVPAEAESEGKHQINVGGGEKWNKIQQAAAMACVPISPRAGLVLEGLPFVGDLIADAFSAFSSMISSLGLGADYTDAALQRYAYSSYATEVTLYKATEFGFEVQSGEVQWDYPDGADVGVLVEHRYYLPIPLVNRYIGEEWSVFSLGPISVDLPGEYTIIRSTAFLPLEGETGSPNDGWAAPPIDGFWD